MNLRITLDTTQKSGRYGVISAAAAFWGVPGTPLPGKSFSQRVIVQFESFKRTRQLGTSSAVLRWRGVAPECSLATRDRRASQAAVDQT